MCDGAMREQRLFRMLGFRGIKRPTVGFGSTDESYGHNHRPDAKSYQICVAR